MIYYDAQARRDCFLSGESSNVHTNHRHRISIEFSPGFGPSQVKQFSKNSGLGSGRAFVPVPSPASARRAHWFTPI
jgi:hypothetical protein